MVSPWLEQVPEPDPAARRGSRSRPRSSAASLPETMKIWACSISGQKKKFAAVDPSVLDAFEWRGFPKPAGARGQLSDESSRHIGWLFSDHSETSDVRRQSLVTAKPRGPQRKFSAPPAETDFLARPKGPGNDNRRGRRMYGPRGAIRRRPEELGDAIEFGVPHTRGQKRNSQYQVLQRKFALPPGKSFWRGSARSNLHSERNAHPHHRRSAAPPTGPFGQKRTFT